MARPIPTVLLALTLCTACGGDDSGSDPADAGRTPIVDAAPAVDATPPLSLPVIELVAQNAQGEPGNGEPAARIAVISDDGRWLIFDSISTNLHPDLTSGVLNLYARDRVTGEVHAIARSSTDIATQALTPTVSDDGRHVCFSSNDENLVASDTNASSDEYVVDRDSNGDGVFDELGTATRMSVASNGTEADAGSYYGAISSTGRFVTFLSRSPSLSGVSEAQVYVRDRDTDGNGVFDETGMVSTTRVASSTDGMTINGQDTRLTLHARVTSDDGRHVAFISSSTNIVTGDNNGLRDIFVVDRDTDGNGTFDEANNTRTTRVTVSATGVEAMGVDAHAQQYAMSRNGRYIAFGSAAGNLVTGDDNDAQDLFLVDRDANGNGVFDEAGQTSIRILSRGVSGASNGDSGDPVFSADGRYIAFESSASNLVANDTNEAIDVFVIDLDPDENGSYEENAVTALVSQGEDGARAAMGKFSANPGISADGQWITFTSDASFGVTVDKRVLYVRRNPLFE